MTLCTAVLVVDCIALVVALQQTSADQFGYCTAEIGLSRRAHAPVYLVVNHTLSCVRVGGEEFLSCEIGSDPFSERTPARRTHSHGSEAIAKKVAQGQLFLAPADKGACFTLGAGDLGYQAQHHESVSWARTRPGQAVQQERDLGRLRA